MILHILLKALLLTLTIWQYSFASEYPGTETRPILSKEEAAKFTPENYFQGWEPAEIIVPEAFDYVVEPEQSIQSVVSQAIKAARSSTRVYIKIQPGHYMETVYINATYVQLTIIGDTKDPSSVHIMASLSAQTSVEDYKNIVNPNGTRYQEGDQAWGFYNGCASRKTGTIGTDCTPVFFVEGEGFQLQGVTVHNGATNAQGIAVLTAGDKFHLMNNVFMGYQDILGLGIGPSESHLLERVLIHMSVIEGQVNYVFGGASVIFNEVTFNTLEINPNSSAIIFAPDTAPENSYGFLVINSNITGVNSNSSKVYLGRSWDQGVVSSEYYEAGKSPNGQLVIRESNIDGVINVATPYAPAATSQRPFSTDLSITRNLDNNTYNRLWEFNNTGDGA